MAKNMTKAQSAAVQLLRSRLDPKHPMFRGSPQVAAALSGEHLRIYLDSWVIPLLDYLVTGEELYYGQAETFKADFAKNEAAGARERQRAIDAGLMKGAA